MPLFVAFLGMVMIEEKDVSLNTLYMWVLVHSWVVFQPGIDCFSDEAKTHTFLCISQA